jgi:hypothetical protein
MSNRLASLASDERLAAASFPLSLMADAREGFSSDPVEFRLLAGCGKTLAEGALT